MSNRIPDRPLGEVVSALEARWNDDPRDASERVLPVTTTRHLLDVALHMPKWSHWK